MRVTYAEVTRDDPKSFRLAGSCSAYYGRLISVAKLALLYDNGYVGSYDCPKSVCVKLFWMLCQEYVLLS
jgi:hypothetical protein